jgi:phosphopantetheine--protein transferase-like protein
MAVRGIGIAIRQIDGLPDPHSDKSFYLSFFTEAEFEESLRRANTRIYMAGRMAAKQAAAKALNRAPANLLDIVVVASESGAVHLRLPEAFADLKTSLSITHEADYAIAVVIAESRQKK